MCDSVAMALFSEVHDSDMYAPWFGLGKSLLYRSSYLLTDAYPILSLQGCSLEGHSTMLENNYDTMPNHSDMGETG